MEFSPPALALIGLLLAAWTAGAAWLAVTRAPAAGGAGPGIGGSDWGGVCNRADNDVNEFVTLSLLRRNECDRQ